MKRIILLFLVLSLISCSKWDIAAIGKYKSQNPLSKMELKMNRNCTLEYNGKIYKGSWQTDAGKSANLVSLYFGDTIIYGVIPRFEADTLEMENVDSFFGSQDQDIIFKKE